MVQNRNDGAKPGGRGFAGMDRAQQREIAAEGGRSVPPEKRSFSQNHNLAAEAGRKGGEARRDNQAARRASTPQDERAKVRAQENASNRGGDVGQRNDADDQNDRKDQRRAEERSTSADESRAPEVRENEEPKKKDKPQRQPSYGQP